MTELDVIFEKFWATAPVPAFFKTAAIKSQARQACEKLLTDFSDLMGRPNAAQTIIAMVKIGRMLQAARVIAQDRDPSPEDISAAVERILERLKKEQHES